MQTGEMIIVNEFCIHHNIQLSFVNALKDSGLIELTIVEEKLYIPENQLPYLEKLVRLYELDINLEGIETITHLLSRMNDLQQEILRLNNRLSIFENG
ncbi:MAG: chaperone modulator CbpM [Ferruginibacter sp.]